MEDDKFEEQLMGWRWDLCNGVSVISLEMAAELIERFNASRDDARRWRTLMGHPCMTGECAHSLDCGEACTADTAAEILTADPRATLEDLAYVDAHAAMMRPSPAPLKIEFTMTGECHSFHGETLAEVVAAAKAWTEPTQGEET